MPKLMTSMPLARFSAIFLLIWTNRYSGTWSIRLARFICCECLLDGPGLRTASVGPLPLEYGLDRTLHDDLSPPLPLHA